MTDAADRIVILNDFSSAEGGAGYLATQLAGGLAGRGLRVTYIAGDGGDGDWPAGVQPVPLGGLRLLDGGALAAARRGLHDAGMARQIRNWIARNDTPRTVYHQHNWSNILSPSVFDALAPVADRCVIHAHDFFLACPNGSYLDFGKVAVCDRVPLSAACVVTACDKRSYPHKLWRVLRQRGLRDRLKPHLAAATFVMVHPAMADRLRRAIRPRHMTAIRNPVMAFGPPVPAPARQTRIAHIGQVQRLKGVFDLAQAARQAGACVDFFGGGEDLADLAARYPEHRYHGFTDRAALHDHLCRARLVVVATQSPEPFNLAAFESIATGLPLVVSDAILAAGELVATGAARAFRAGNVADLTAVLTGLMADDAAVAALAQAARQVTGQQDMDSWVDAHLALYRRILRPVPMTPLTQEVATLATS